MNFTIFNSLILAGIIQGFIFVAIVLSSKKYRYKSILYLVTLILAYSLSNLEYLISDIGLISYVNMYSYLWIPFASLLTPIFYLYYSYYLNPSKNKILIFEKLLFLPFLIFLTLTIIFRIGIIYEFEFFTFNNFYLYVIRINEIFSVLFCLTFLIIPLIHVVFYKKEKLIYDSKFVRPNIDWLNFTFVILSILTIYWGYLTYKNFFTPKQGQVSYNIFWIGVSIAIYWLGYMGIYKYGILLDRTKIRTYNTKTLKIVSSIQKINKHIQVLENLFLNEKIYLDSRLTLQSVADKMHLSKSHLSRIINAELNTSFTDYLNSFRIEEAKSYLNNPDFSKYTITAIGLEAGFNSKSAFFDVFKKATGKAPTTYKKGIENQIKAEVS
jgi:AraC-like DNA-binding protein